VAHLLVTNDFPPKVGGIQSYLWELWRRLPPDDVTVFTIDWPGAVDFDAKQAFRVERVTERMLLPTGALVEQVDALADEVGAELVLIDPAVPAGLIGPRLRHPYGVVLHGSEVTVPGRLPGARRLLGRVLRGATLVVAAGGYPAAEGERAAGRPLPTVVVPPSVDTERFRPLEPHERADARRRLDLDPDGLLVTSVSRLVPRKGMDVFIRAMARLVDHHPRLQGAIAGDGRDRRRLERLVEATGSPVRVLGRLSDDDLPAVYGCADVFAMLCRSRWAGLEQEGFGIVFLEAAACGVPQVAGSSGGAAEAVLEGETGLIVRRPADVDDVTDALDALLSDPERRERMAVASRARAVDHFGQERLAATLAAALERVA